MIVGESSPTNFVVVVKLQYITVQFGFYTKSSRDWSNKRSVDRSIDHNHRIESSSAFAIRLQCNLAILQLCDALQQQQQHNKYTAVCRIVLPEGCLNFRLWTQCWELNIYLLAEARCHDEFYCCLCTLCTMYVQSIFSCGSQAKVYYYYFFLLGIFLINTTFYAAAFAALCRSHPSARPPSSWAWTESYARSWRARHFSFRCPTERIFVVFRTSK